MERRVTLYGWLVGIAVALPQAGSAAEPSAPIPNSEQGAADPADSPLAAASGTTVEEAEPTAAQPADPNSPPPPRAEADVPKPEAPPQPPAAPKPPLQPWKLLFFDNDFSYKKDPNHKWLLGEELKDIPLDLTPWDCCPQESWFSTGGELRYRMMDERNRLRPGGPDQSNYDLLRWRHYVDYHYSDLFRAYVEMIDASMFRNTLPVTGIDVNRWDLQNAFVDVKVGEWDEKPIYFRAGRQELLYGSQRLISPLDWGNTRRNFEGLKLFSKGTDWDLDLWFTRPVNTATPGNGPVARFDNEFDSPNMDHTFSGFWSTYKGIKDNTFDFYWIWDRNSKLISPGFPGGNRHTLATRWLGNKPVLDACGAPCRIYHVDIEGGYQFGNDFGRDVQAGFFTAGAGHTWNQAPWEPNFWVFYDWASGDRNPTNGTTNTFHQQYGLVHAYLGLIDNIARQNISDINWRATVKPTKQLNCQAAMHYFNLASNQDVLYTITGAPLGAQGTGTYVGQELDLLATYTFNPNFNVQVGQFWFWNGSFIRNNAPRGTAEQFYVQTTLSY